MKTALFKKRTQFAAYLRSQWVNAVRMLWCALKKRAAEGSALKITENRRRQLAEVFVNSNTNSRKGNRNFPQRTPICQRLGSRKG